MKIFICSLVCIFCLNSLSAKVLYVSQNGGTGVYAKIQLALNNAVAGDTVKIMPGNYNEQITISENVVVQGSGAKSTLIYGAFAPVVIQSAGKLMWVTITSQSGNGIEMSGGTCNNLLVSGCKRNGIYSSNTTVKVKNVILEKNSNYGFICKGEIWNSMAINNSVGFIGCYGGDPICHNCLAYNNYTNFSSDVVKDHCLEIDPLFDLSTDYKLSTDSPCIDAGDPSAIDPDGTKSDIGYYGGPDAPIQPYLVAPSYKLGEDGTIQFLLKGIIGYGY